MEHTYIINLLNNRLEKHNAKVIEIKHHKESGVYLVETHNHFYKPLIRDDGKEVESISTVKSKTLEIREIMESILDEIN